MSEIILSSPNALPVPRPKEELTFRDGVRDDIEFIDKLQKQYNNQLGFMPTMWLEGKIKANHVLIASIGGERVGYIIAQDKYMRREELGIVYQLAVIPGKQRGFIGAALLQAQFDRSAYGCRLYCCWCAQDIQANRFWESMGFVPIAHRNGAEKKGRDGKHRVQIFWEKKIRGNDDTFPWWFPAKTDNGAMRADRLALPIRPGVHWSEVEPIEIPGVADQPEKLPDRSRVKRNKVEKVIVPVKTRAAYGPPGMIRPAPVVKAPEPIVEKPKRIKKPKQKIDPKFIAASRELRDRYLEQVNEMGFKLESAGKYELVKQINGEREKPQLMLDAAESELVRKAA